MPDADEAPIGGSLRLMVVEDDPHFRDRLVRAMTERGYTVTAASCLADAREVPCRGAFHAALLDFKLPDGSGLTLIPDLRSANPAMRIVVLSGYATLGSAVTAVKGGAIDYLVKPIDADEIDAVLRGAGASAILEAHEGRQPNEVRWRHIEATLRTTNGNVSSAARTLNLHRRTLQRILSTERGRPK